MKKLITDSLELPHNKFSQNNLLLHVRIHVISIFILLLSASGLHASNTFILDSPDQVIIGENSTYTIQDRESLVELAREYSIGYNEIIEANRNIDPWVPEKGAELLIPGQWLIPDGLEDGIVINLAELRLYYTFTLNGKKHVHTHAIGTGRKGWGTPTGTFKITMKVKDPIWKVPAAIREEKPELPLYVYPGPDNPLGRYWIQLSAKGYGIHGTNRPYGIGRRVSHGCLRLYPEGIEELYKIVKPGTRVKIMYEPVKAGIYKDSVYIEIHYPEKNLQELIKIANETLGRKNLLNKVDTALLMKAVSNANGLPAVISK
jgi:L,D-transpeptidase ErfK/SrfK